MNIRQNSAFTMIEIIVVLVIIAGILALVGPRIARQFLQSKEKMTALRINNLKNSLLEYSKDVGHFPTKKEGNLEALVKKPEAKEAVKWNGPYAKEEELLDASNQDFEYNLPPVKFKDKYKIYEIISTSQEGKEIDGGE